MLLRLLAEYESQRISSCTWQENCEKAVSAFAVAHILAVLVAFSRQPLPTSIAVAAHPLGLHARVLCIALTLFFMSLPHSLFHGGRHILFFCFPFIHCRRCYHYSVGLLVLLYSWPLPLLWLLLWKGGMIV
jgi:hypothetical protein